MEISAFQVSELEDMWAGEETLLRHSLDDVQEKVTPSHPHTLTPSHPHTLTHCRRLSGRD